MKTIILGAGVTGLYTAKELSKKNSKQILILEKNSYVGGLCSSFKKNNFTIDFGPHKLFSLRPDLMNEFKKINGKNNLVVKKINSIFFLDKKFQFPIKPFELLKNISLKTIFAGILVPLSFMKSFFVYNILRKKDNNFEDYLIKGFGKKMYKILFEGYAWKVWDNPKKLSKDIAKIRIPLPNVGDLIKKTLHKKSQVQVNAKEFYYPKYGMKEFVENIAKDITKKGTIISLNQSILKIDKKDNKFIIKTNKNTYICEKLINTIPLESFLKVYSPTKKEIKQAISKLRYNDLSLIHLFFNKKNVISDNWIFFPESKFSFNRLSEQKSFSKYTVPKDKTVLCAEITNPKTNKLKEEEILSIVINNLIDAKIISNKKEVLDYNYIRFNNIYPIYDINYKENLNKVLEFLESEGIITIGRFGLFNYNNIDHCMDMAKKCADYISTKSSIEEWKKIRKTSFNYKIID